MSHRRKNEFIKLSILGVFAVVCSIAGWILIRNAFLEVHFEETIPSLAIIWKFVGAFLVFFAAYAFFGNVAALAMRTDVPLALSVALPITMLAVLGINPYTGIAAFVWLLGLIQLSLKVREERLERRKVSIHKYLRNGLPLGMSALILAISLAFYSVSLSSGGSNIDPAEVLARTTANRLNQFLGVEVPGYREDLSVNEFILLLIVKLQQDSAKAEAATIPPTDAAEDLVSAQIPTGWLGLDLTEVNSALNEVQREELLREVPDDFLEQAKRDPQVITDLYETFSDTAIETQINATRDALLDQFHVTAQGGDQIGPVMERAFAVKYRDLFGPFTYLIPPVVALGLFFILQIFGFVYVLITQFFALIIFALLHWARFFLVHEETTTAEKISLE